MRTKEYDEAIRFYNNSINYDPAEPTTYCNRALAFIKKKNFEKGLKDCDEAIKLKKDYSKAFYRRAICLIGLKRFKDSLEDLLFILRDAPTNEEILSELRNLKEKWRETVNNSDEWSRIDKEIDADVERVKVNKYQFKGDIQKDKEKIDMKVNVDAKSGNNINIASGTFKKMKIVEEDTDDSKTVNTTVSNTENIVIPKDTKDTKNFTKEDPKPKPATTGTNSNHIPTLSTSSIKKETISSTPTVEEEKITPHRSKIL